jgi:HlyD family secretion protein
MNPPTSHPSDNPPDTTGNPPHTGHPREEKRGFYRKYSTFIWLGGILAITATAIAVFFILRLAIREPFTGLTYKVQREILRVTIVERGNLESAENSDIVCRVKAKTQGGTIASTIKWVIDDGTQVKAGELIVDLDDSGFQEQLKTQKNTLNKARSDWVEAKTNYTIQESQNLSDKKTSEVELIQAKLELKKYAGEVAGAKMINLVTYEQIQAYLRKDFEGDVRQESAQLEGKFTSAYLQDVSAYEGTIETARSDKDSWMDRASWSQRMVKKGFYSLSQADADQSRLESMKIALRKAEGDLDIYRIFEREKNVTKKWSDVKEAERKKDRVETQADSKIEKARADEESKKAIYDQEDEKLQDLKKEEKFYKITAPQDGLIVYYIPEQARFGGGSQQATVAQGEPVREGQKLIRIPNLSKMLVNARVHEAMADKVKGEKIKQTGFSERMRATIAIGRQDLWGVASYQMGLSEFFVRNESYRDKDQIVEFPGHTATIRVDAFPGRSYNGHVKTVANVPSQADPFSADVKLYTTMVSVDDLDAKSEKLKPGMSAQVTILADATKKPVLVMPIQAVVGSVASGAERFCYVLDSDRVPQKRKITVGMSNDKMVEIKTGVEEGDIKTGVEEGDEVVLNPRGLLPEKSEMKPGVPGPRRGPESEEGGPAKKKKGDGPGKGIPAGKAPATKGAEQTFNVLPVVRPQFAVLTKEA